MSKLSTLALFFAFLCFQANALPFFGDHSFRNPIMNAHANSSGIINLKKDADSDGAFYVEADLTSSSSHSSLTVTDTVRMMVSIANNQTMVVSDCFSFSEYDCNRYNCSNYGWMAAVDFPTFTAHVKYGRSSIYLDYNYWGLNDAHLFYAQYCESRASPGTGTNRSGILGLGTGNESLHHFISSPIFSILIDSDQNGGKLLFKKDSNYTKSSPLHKFSSNDTWQITVDQGSIETPSGAVAFKGNIVFDINSDVIGLPYDVYGPFYTNFWKTPNVTCQDNTYRPSCTTTLKLEDLPDLTLSINGDKIKIPSKIYATLKSETETEKSFWFNFKQIHESMTGKSYVPLSFQNSIILDANFMSYYYTLFDATSGSNKISIYSTAVTPSPQPNPTSWWILVVIIAIMVIGVSFYAYKKKGAAKTKGLYQPDPMPQVYLPPPPAGDF